MPYPGKLPDDRTELLRLDRTYSRAEIARMFGSTRAAVTRKMEKHRIGHSRSRVGGARSAYREEIPWKVAAEHASDYALRQLRAYGAKRRGMKLSPSRAKALAEFEARMQELDAVVAYDRNRHPQPFYLVPRRPEDKGYTRHPDLDTR